MLHKIAPNLFTKSKMKIDKGKRSKTLNEVKQVENINKNLVSYLQLSLLPSYKLQDSRYEQ